MKRLSAMEVWQAYEATGLRPEQGNYFPSVGAACGVGAVASNHIGHAWVNAFTISEFLELFKGDYIDGFYTGFDGVSLSGYASDGRKTGYSDGRRAWIFCIQLWAASQSPVKDKEQLELVGV